MKFGILSTANIGLKSVIPAVQATGHDVSAIASRDESQARTVAQRLDIPNAYGSYEALLQDETIDAVYNPLPNALHAEWTKRAADAGKHVLVEKPFATNRDEAAETLAFVHNRDVTVMEAFMYLFHPRTQRAIEIAEEELTNVHTFSGEFSFGLGDRTDDIRLDPTLAGGSLMDVGCYPVNAARQFLGEPDRVDAVTVDRRESGVDTEMAAILEYDDGSIARVASGFDTPLTQRYRVEADDGWLEVKSAFDAPDDRDLTVTYEVDGEQSTDRFDPLDQYRLEVEHFASVVEGSSTLRVDAADTLGTMAVIDAIDDSAKEGRRVAVSSEKTS